MFFPSLRALVIDETQKQDQTNVHAIKTYVKWVVVTVILGLFQSYQNLL